MTGEKKYVVFIDLDKTLLKVNSGKIFILSAYKQGLISFMSLLKAFFISVKYKLHIEEDTKIITKSIAGMSGLSEISIINLSKEIIKNTLIPLIRPSVIKETEYHKNRGGEIVLLSAALTYICEPIAEYTGIKHVICSETEVKNGILTGNLTGKICMGIEKKVRAERYCVQNSFNLSDAFCYGDSITDKYIMSVTGNPVCVEPDKKLKKLAIKNNWRIITK